MPPWLPFVICLALAVSINVYPLFMAFVVKSKKWQSVGWIYYIFTFPIGLALLLLGVILSLFFV